MAASRIVNGRLPKVSTLAWLSPSWTHRPRTWTRAQPLADSGNCWVGGGERALHGLVRLIVIGQGRLAAGLSVGAQVRMSVLQRASGWGAA
jgi:hypothetical protein